MESASHSSVEVAQPIRSKLSEDETLTWYRGASPKPRYLGLGRPWKLYGQLDYLRGLRGAIEQLAMRLVTPVFRGPAVDEPELLIAWEAVRRLIGSARDALLLYTKYYKGTIFVGPVLAGQPLFVKVFSHESDARAETSRRDRIHNLAAAFFRIPRIEHAEEGVLCYELLPHNRRRPSSRAIASSALALGRASLLASGGAVPIRKLVDLDRLTALASAAFLPAIARAATMLAAVDELVPIARAHGDLTPWNVFLDVSGTICLVDYERVADASPFFDAFHVISQPRCLKGNASIPGEMIASVAREAAVEIKTALFWYLAYLLLQLATDLDDFINQGRRHRQLRTLIRAKTQLLVQAIGTLNSVRI